MTIKKRIVSIFVATLLAFTCTVCTCNTRAEAKHVKNGIVRDKNGNIYIYKNGKRKTGWVKYHGNTYYCHKTASKKYPKGSAVRGQFKIKSGNKWYAFGTDGKMIKKDQYVRKGRTKKILQLDIRRRNHTVRYVYSTSRTRMGYRYNTSLCRYEYQLSNGKWRTIEGMPFYPDDWVDFQK